MSGICGWVNHTRELVEDASFRLDRMTSGLVRLPGDIIEMSTGSHHAVAVLGGRGHSGLCVSDGVVALYEGHLTCRPANLRGVAESHGTAAALVEAYRTYGAEFPVQLEGPGAIALIDTVRRAVYLSVDRLGIRPLALVLIDDGVAFASDARILRELPGAHHELDPQAIFNYFYFHMVPSPRTIYQGVEKLCPGECAMLSPDGFRKFVYWRPHYDERTSAPFAALAEEFRTTLESAVRRADDGGPTGCFLSGGTDSSTISGYFRKTRSTAIDTFSIGFNADGFDETEYARIAAKHFQTTPHEYYLTPDDVVTAIPLIARSYDEPFGNASVIPTYFCAKLAREHGMQTLLAGDGGDELFGGNARYAKQLVFEGYSWFPRFVRTGLIEPLARSIPNGDRIPPVRKLRSYIDQANVPLPDRLETYNFLNRQPLGHVFDADFLRSVSPSEPVEHLRKVYRVGAAQSALNRMMQVDLKITLADNDLRKVNRAAELAGVQVRYPLLDEAVVDFSLGIPSALKLRNLQLRYFFKEALRDVLPPEILKKSKHGFGLPFGLWMNTHESLRDMANASLDRLAERGYLNPRYLTELRERRATEHASYFGVMIWVAMMFEQWLGSV